MPEMKVSRTALLPEALTRVLPASPSFQESASAAHQSSLCLCGHNAPSSPIIFSFAFMRIRAVAFKAHLDKLLSKKILNVIVCQYFAIQDNVHSFWGLGYGQSVFGVMSQLTMVTNAHHWGGGSADKRFAVQE